MLFDAIDIMLGEFFSLVPGCTRLVESLVTSKQGSQGYRLMCLTFCPSAFYFSLDLLIQSVQ